MKQLFILFGVAFLFACEDKVETRYIDVRALSASELYKSDSVFAYMNRYKDQNKDLAKTYKEKAKQQTDNPEKAIYYLKRSISLLPNKESYMELATLLSHLGRYDEVSRVYNLTNFSQYFPGADKKRENEYLFGPPDEDMVYENMLNTILQSNSLYGDALYVAEEVGVSREKLKERLINEKRITMDKNSPDFKNILIQFLPYEHLDSIARQPESFRNFLTSFHDTSDHFQITANTVSEFNYEDYNGRNYMGEMGGIWQGAIDVFYLKEKQENKDKWFQFNMTHYYKVFPSVNVIVYAIDTSATACPGEMRHVYHRLATYNNDGQIIDSRVIALQSGEDQKTAEINKTIITMQLVKRSWKKPYDKYDFDNQVTDTKVLGTERYEIQNDGSIRQQGLAETFH